MMLRRKQWVMCVVIDLSLFNCFHIHMLTPACFIKYDKVMSGTNVPWFDENASVEKSQGEPTPFIRKMMEEMEKNPEYFLSSAWKIPRENNAPAP